MQSATIRPDPLAPPPGYGQRPWLLREDDGTDSETCIFAFFAPVSDDLFSFGGASRVPVLRQCGAPSAVRLFTACVHEHIARVNLCVPHGKVYEEAASHRGPYALACNAACTFGPGDVRQCGERMTIGKKEIMQ